MKADIRAEAARFYDYNPNLPNDVPFYEALVPSQDASVLELGCGTGRVTVPLAARCGKLVGLDRSPAMIDVSLDLADLHGFQMVGKWGGYAGESYGEGSELVIQFAR